MGCSSIEGYRFDPQATTWIRAVHLRIPGRLQRHWHIVGRGRGRAARSARGESVDLFLQFKVLCLAVNILRKFLGVVLPALQNNIEPVRFPRKHDTSTGAAAVYEYHIACGERMISIIHIIPISCALRLSTWCQY